MNQETQHIIAQIKARIDKTRAALERQELFTAATKAFSVVGLLGTLFVFIESLADFSAHTRTILVYTHVTLSTIITVWLVWKPLLRFLHILPPPSDREVARLIGAKFEKIGDRLQNALDLSDMLKNGDFSSSPELIEVSLEHFGKSTVGINFASTVSFSQLQNLLKVVGTITTVVSALAVIPGTPFHDAFDRMVHFDKEFVPAPAFLLSVAPGNVDVVKGGAVDVVARVSSGDSKQPLPDELTIAYSEEGVDVTENILLRADSTGAFRFHFPAMKQTTRYRVFSGGISSEKYLISVTDRPFVRSLAVSIAPPSYTKLPHQTLEENVGDVLTLPGSRVRWNVEPSKEIVKATIVFKDGAEIAMRHNGEKWTAEFTPLAPTSYLVELEDAQGNVNQDPIEYRIGMMTDEYPTIAIVSPGKNIDVTEAMMLPMEFNVNDDFGVAQLQLKFRLVQSKYSSTEKEAGTIVPFDTLTIRSGVLDYAWDLSLLGLVPEDVVEYYAEVQDNDAVNGPKSARSSTFLIRLPSLEEVFADADKSHDDAQKSLEESVKEAQELQKSLRELSDDMKRNQQMDWQKQKKAEEVLKKYEEVRKTIDDVAKQMDEMTQNLQRNNTLSKETLEKYMELQKTLAEIDSPEFRKAMQRMQDAMQNVNPEQMREAMEQAQFSEEQFRQGIERTMKLLKRIQIEQKVDELQKRAEQMRAAEEEIKQQTKQLKQNDAQKATELAQKQDAVNEQLNALQKELSDLRKKMEEFPKEMPMSKLDNAQNAANNRDMQKAMKQSSQQLRSLQMEKAMTAQQQASSGINEMQEQLSELQEQMLNNQMQQTMNALRKASQDLLLLSQKQEQLKNKTRSLDPNSQQFRDVAREQQNLQSDLNTVSNALAALSEQSFVVTPEMGKQIGRAMAQMEQSMGAVEQRNGSAASSMQGDAMSSLNRSATLMQGAMKQMQQQGGQGGGSLMQQLRNMAMQQQQINAQTEQLGQQEGGMSPQRMQEIGRLARQQEAVRKSMEQLQKEAQGSPERDKVLGDLSKIANDMKEVVERLQQNDVDPSTIDRQERILSRMLQAQRSMRERDFEQKRTATAGIAPVRRTPPPVTLSNAPSAMQKDLQRAQEAGYSKDYLDLIRRYYESINKTN